MVATLPAAVLAQQFDWDRVIVWAVVLVGFAIAGAVVLVVIRKALMSDGPAAPKVGFGLRDLEAMRDRGELTDEEYKRAREKMLARLAGDDDEHQDADAGEVPIDVVPDPESDDPPDDATDGTPRPDKPTE